MISNFFSKLFDSEESEVEKELKSEAREVRAFSDLNEALNSVVSLTDQGNSAKTAFEAYKAKIRSGNKRS